MSDDLILLGMEADRVRAALHPDGFVTYCRDASTTGELVPLQPGMTGTEYLQLLARTRIAKDVENLQVDWRGTGWKLAQIALRFGADDLGSIEGADEQDVRRIIRDAGFVPKARNGDCTLLALD